MTPMLRELHEARKERLQRMKAWQAGNVVPLRRVRAAKIKPPKAATPQPRLEEHPKPEPIPPALTPIDEIETPVVVENTNVSIRQIQVVVAKRYRISLAEI